MTLAQRITAARAHKGLTQDALAKAVGVSQQAIQKLETGKAASSRRLTQIAIACDVRPEWLANESGPMTSKPQVKDEGPPYNPAFQSQSQPLQFNIDKLHAAAKFLEEQFSKRRREFIPSQHIHLLTGVYDFMVSNPTANAVALITRFDQLMGGDDEREGTTGSTEPANRRSDRSSTTKTKATVGRKG